MKFINRKTHAVLDYLVGIIMISSPWLFDFAANPLAKWTVIVLGLLALVMSLMTDYEGGIVRKLPMGAHLNIDAISGILLAVSPWVLGFHNQVYLPHLLLGLLEIIAAICTQSRSQHAPLQGNIRNPSF
jgi:hypothetical protein